MTRILDRVIAALQQHMQRETSSTLCRGMHYPTQHFRFHQRQLTLSPPHT